MNINDIIILKNEINAKQCYVKVAKCLKECGLYSV